jgi:hypothetical protein
VFWAQVCAFHLGTKLFTSVDHSCADGSMKHAIYNFFQDWNWADRQANRELIATLQNEMTATLRMKSFSGDDA